MIAPTPGEIAAARALLDEGTLPDRCSIARKQSVSDGGGGRDDVWVPVASDVPCRLHPASAVAGGGPGIAQGGGRLNDATTHLVTLSAGTDAQLEDQITVADRVFEVLQVRSGGGWELQRHAEVKEAG